MVTRLVLLLIIIRLHQVSNSPMRIRRSPRELQSHQPVLISHSVPVLQQNFYGQKNILTQIPVSQLYIHPKLHVIPHNTVQHVVTKDNVRIIAQTLQQNRNYTHPNLLPILIPLHNIVSTGNRLIPVHDLTVIPLQRKGQYNSRVAAEKKDENNDDASNQYRNFYGGYGTGLFFGGHGSGHGYYAYGK